MAWTGEADPVENAKAAVAEVAAAVEEAVDVTRTVRPARRSAGSNAKSLGIMCSPAWTA